MSLQQDTIERLKRAKQLGVKISAIYKAEGLSAYRITCITSGLSSRHSEILTDDEIEAINRHLDKIKKAL